MILVNVVLRFTSTSVVNSGDIHPQMFELRDMVTTIQAVGRKR